MKMSLGTKVGGLPEVDGHRVKLVREASFRDTIVCYYVWTPRCADLCLFFKYKGA